MRHSSFILIAGIGIFISGMTWAGPPDQMPENDESYQSETMEETTEESLPVDEGQATKPVILTFEEAVAACKDEENLQACVDVKTGITEEVSEEVTEEVFEDTETETLQETEEADCDPWMDGTTCPEE